MIPCHQCPMICIMFDDLYFDKERDFDKQPGRILIYHPQWSHAVAYLYPGSAVSHS